MILFYKSINRMDKISWSKEPRKLTQNNESYLGYSLRRQSASLFKQPITNCKYREEFFLNIIVLIWNSLPIGFKEVKSLYSF